MSKKLRKDRKAARVDVGAKEAKAKKKMKKIAPKKKPKKGPWNPIKKYIISAAANRARKAANAAVIAKERASKNGGKPKVKRVVVKKAVKKVVKVKVVTTKFKLELPITKEDFPDKQKKISADMARSLGLPRKSVKAMLAPKKAMSLTETGDAAEEDMGVGLGIKFVVKEKKVVKKNQAKKKKKSAFALRLARQLSDMAKGKVKLGGIKVPKQKVAKPVRKVKVKKKIVKKIIRIVKLVKQKVRKFSMRDAWRFEALKQRSKARGARNYAVDMIARRPKTHPKRYPGGETPKKAGFLGASATLSCHTCVKTFDSRGGCGLLRDGAASEEIHQALSDQCLHCGTASSLHCAKKMLAFSTDATDVTPSASTKKDSWLKGMTPAFRA